MVVICACGKKLKAPAAAAGKKARCPGCGNTLVLAAGGSAPPSSRTTVSSAKAVVRKAPGPIAVARRPKVAPPAPVMDDDGLGALFELAEQAKVAEAPVEGARCSQCKAALEEGAILCTNCGFDTRTGKALASASVAKPAKLSAAGVAGKRGKQPPVDMMAPQGSFVAGLAMSAAFALAASILWFAFAWATGFVIGYIAILIGGAAGAGMKIGQKGFSSAGGFAAAGMTVLGILLAKLALLEFVILPLARVHSPGASISSLNQAALAYFFFRPISIIIMLIGMGAAYRTANGSVSG